MYIQNRRNSSKFKGCSPLQNCNGLISLKPTIAYFAYTQRCRQANALNSIKVPFERTVHQFTSILTEEPENSIIKMGLLKS
jgi:hypothetical protein